MVPGDKPVNALVKKIPADSRRNAKPVSRIFNINQNGIWTVCLFKLGKIVQDCFSAGSPDHIATINNPQIFYLDLKNENPEGDFQ